MRRIGGSQRPDRPLPTKDGNLPARPVWTTASFFGPHSFRHEKLPAPVGALGLSSARSAISSRVCVGLDGGGAMRRLLALGEFDQVFDAEDMQILSAAFDKAWEAVQASGVIYQQDKIELVRAILAKHIIAAAKDGERDHSRLRDGALLALAKSDLRSTSR